MIYKVILKSKTLDMQEGLYDLEQQCILSQEFYLDEYDESIIDSLKMESFRIKRDWLNFDYTVLDGMCVFCCELMLFIGDEDRDSIRQRVKESYLNIIRDATVSNEIPDFSSSLIDRIDDGMFITIGEEGSSTISYAEVLKSLSDLGVEVVVVSESHNESHSGASGGEDSFLIFVKQAIESGVTYDAIKLAVMTALPAIDYGIRFIKTPTTKKKFRKLTKEIASMKGIKQNELVLKEFYQSDDEILVTFVHRGVQTHVTCDIDYNIKIILSEEVKH